MGYSFSEKIAWGEWEQHTVFNTFGATEGPFFMLCFMVVIGYILYISISFINFCLKEDDSAVHNPAMKQLMQHHKFRDNLVPLTVRNMYEPQSYGILPEKTPLIEPVVECNLSAPIHESEKHPVKPCVQDL